MRKKGIPFKKMIKIVVDMCNKQIQLKLEHRKDYQTCSFYIEVGLHQLSALSPFYLSYILVDVLCEEIQTEDFIVTVCG